MMNGEIRNEIAEYVLESERAMQLAAENANKLKAEITACKGITRNLEEIVLQQQESLAPLQVEEKAQLRKKKRNDTYTKQALVTAFGSSDCCVESPLF